MFRVRYNMFIKVYLQVLEYFRQPVHYNVTQPVSFLLTSFLQLRII